jgi:hypothetical protein
MLGWRNMLHAECRVSTRSHGCDLSLRQLLVLLLLYLLAHALHTWIGILCLSLFLVNTREERGNNVLSFMLLGGACQACTHQSSIKLL